VTGDAWKELKESGKLEFGSVPMLELDDGTRLVQSMVILDYLNSTLCKAGLQQNDDPMVQYNANCCVALWGEDFMMKHMMPMMFAPEDKKEEIVKAILGEHLPKVMGHLNRKMPATKFFLGDKMSKQDCALAVFWTNMYQEKDDDKMKDFKSAIKGLLEGGEYPKFKTYVDNVRETLKDHLASRPKCSF
jgi:glutathione S-transferase